MPESYGPLNDVRGHLTVRTEVDGSVDLLGQDGVAGAGSEGNRVSRETQRVGLCRVICPRSSHPEKVTLPQQ